MKLRFPLIILMLFLISCGKKQEVNVEQEKNEVIQFLKSYTSFINLLSTDGFENYWERNDEVSYIPLEKDTAIVGFDNIKNHFDQQNSEMNSVKYSTWNPVVWVNVTKSEAVLIFQSSKLIEFRNGFKLELSPIRNSMTLTKFEGMWKIINLHESVRQK